MSARDMAMSLRVLVVFGRCLAMSDDVLAMSVGCIGSWRWTDHPLRGCSEPGVGGERFNSDCDGVGY